MRRLPFVSQRDRERRIDLMVEKWEERKAIDEGDRMEAAGMTNEQIRAVFAQREAFKQLTTERLSLDDLND